MLRWRTAATPGTARRQTADEYGLSPTPRAARSRSGSFRGTRRPAAFTAIADVVRTKFGLQEMVIVGDRGMITSTRIQALDQLETTPGRQTRTPTGGSPRSAPTIKKLMAEDGPLQLSLFDQQDLAEITSPGFPGERLIACRNAVLAADRDRTRTELLAATAELLAPLIAGRPGPGSPAPGRSASRSARWSAGTRPARLHRHHHRHQPHHRPQAGPDRRRSRLDGFTCCAPRPRPGDGHGHRGHRLRGACRIRRDATPGTSNPTTWTYGPSPPARGTRQSPRADLHARLLPHLAPAPRPGPADLHRPGPARPGQPGRPGPPLRGRPGQGLRPARPDRAAFRGFRALLEHLATLTRDQVRYTGTQITVPMLTEPTAAQRQAFSLLGVPIPLT